MGGKRRVVIGADASTREVVMDTLPAIPTRSKLEGQIETPTGDIRHMSHIRNGRVPGDVFSKANLAKIPVNSDSMIEEGGRKETDNARKKPQTAEVGVRGEGSSVGQEASLQPAESKGPKAKARKKVARKKGDNA